ncbi:MAG: PAS domain-containing protein [Candidatus Fermentibacteraceae bacterium]
MIGRIVPSPIEEVFLNGPEFPVIPPEVLLDGVDCSVTIIDRSRTVRVMNLPAQKLSGSPWHSGDDGVLCHLKLFNLDGPCPGCPATEAFATGLPTGCDVEVAGRCFVIKAIPEKVTGLVVCCIREVTETRDLLARLEAGERQYSRIVSGMPVGIVIGEIITDSRGRPQDYRILEANPAFEDHTGVPADKVLNKRITKVFPNMKEHLGVELFANVVITGEPVELCGFSKMIHRHIHFFVFCVQPGRFALIINDLSERKAVEDRLRLVESAVDASTDEVYFLNESGYFVYGNTAVSEKLGVKRQDLKSIHISSFNPSISPEWWSDFLAQIRKRGHFQIESVHRRGDGTQYPVELNSTLVKTERSEMICTIARDTTAQTTELTTLSRSRDHMENALDAAALGFWALSPLSGNFSSDRRWAVLTGQGNAPLSGAAEDLLYPAIHIGDRRRLRLELTSSPHENGVVGCRLSGDEGARRIRIRWHRSRDKAGLKIVAVVEDTTSERLLGLAAVGSDSPGMEALLSYSGDLLARLKKTSDAAAAGDIHSVRRLLSDITDDMESLTPPEVEFEDSVYLDTFLKEMSPTVKDLLGRGSGFTLDIPPSASVHVSPELLERFFMRLAGFAGCEFSEGVSMRVWSLSGCGVTGIMRLTADIEAAVPNSGINPGHPALIEAYAAVRAMKGTVSAERTGEGIRFTVNLPGSSLEPSGRVVIASDNDIEGRTVGTVLRHMNLRCQVFPTANEALEALEPGDTLVLSAGLPDFPCELPDRSLVLGSGYSGPAFNLRKPWTIIALRAAVRRVMQSG